jgi:leucyl-tRNA---protein transferase
METLFDYVAPPSPCGYLPDRLWSLQYEMVGAMSAGEYMDRLEAGWRRFGSMLFRPRCPGCQACQSLRVLVDRFHLDRSQRRAFRANAGRVELRIGEPSVSSAKLKLYDRYHSAQTETKGWPEHAAKDAAGYHHSFVDNPFATEEWCYYQNNQLVGVGYVDCLARGLSAIYFFSDPALRKQSLGTFNVLCILAAAADRALPHVYLGYYVAGCPSLSYKARFAPNQILRADGIWQNFRT